MNRNLNRRIHPIAEANGLSPKFHCKPYIKELNIKLRYIEEEEPEAYRDEEGTTKEG